MKKVLLGLMALLALHSATAQDLIPFKFGIKGGVATTSVNNVSQSFIDPQDPSKRIEMVSSQELQWGFQAGLFARVTTPLGWYVQPEILYSSVASAMTLRELQNASTLRDELKKSTFNRIDIPVMFGKKLGPVRLNLGPVANITISNSSDLSNVAGYEQKFNSATWGLQAGVGLDLGEKFIADLRYETSLSALGDGVNYKGQKYSFDTRPQMFLLTVGYCFR